jgi:hypothetical protein
MSIVALSAGITQVSAFLQVSLVAQRLGIGVAFLAESGGGCNRLVIPGLNVRPTDLRFGNPIFNPVAALAANTLPIGLGDQWIADGNARFCLEGELARDTVWRRIDLGVWIVIHRRVAPGAVRIWAFSQVVCAGVSAFTPGVPISRLVGRGRGYGCGEGFDDWGCHRFAGK